MPVQVLNELPAQVLLLNDLSTDELRQKWQGLARHILQESQDDEACERAYNQSEELLRYVTPALVTAVFHASNEDEGSHTDEEQLEMPEELRKVKDPSVNTINQSSFDRHFKEPFGQGQQGALFVTSKRILFALVDGQGKLGSGKTLSFGLDSLILHAIPEEEEGEDHHGSSSQTSKFLCHISCIQVLDDQGEEINLKDSDQGDLSSDVEFEDKDLEPYFEVVFSLPSKDQVNALYLALTDASMLAGYSPSIAQRMLAEATGCCGSVSRSGGCCSMASTGCCGGVTPVVDNEEDIQEDKCCSSVTCCSKAPVGCCSQDEYNESCCKND